MCIRDRPYPELCDAARGDSERARLTQLFALAEDEMIDAQLGLGDFQRAIADLESRLVLHPYRERCYAQLMRALYQDGRQAEALATYQRARTVLDDELGLEPGPALRELEARILSHDISVAPYADDELTNSRAATESILANPDARLADAFVGRERELDLAAHAVQAAAMVTVIGDAGIGKTSFVEELIRRCENIHWIRLSIAPDRLIPPMSQLCDQLGIDLGGVVDAGEEFRRNATIIDALAGVASAPGLVVDDMQWADEGTARFVRQLANHAIRPCPVVVTARSAPAYLETVGGESVIELTRHSSTVAIDLGPLTTREVRELVPPDQSPDRWRDLSGGNPFFLKQMLLDGGSADRVGTVRNLVADRLNELDEQTRSVLATAAVLGSTIESNAVLRVCEQPVAEVLRALDAGRRHGLLRLDDAGTLSGSFAHELLRQALLDQLGALDRSVLHDRAAAAFSDRIVVDPAMITRRAHHSFEALPLGSASRAVDALVAAGEQAVSQFSFVDACAHYERARVATEYLDPDERDAVLPRVLCELGRTQIRSGDSDHGAEVLSLIHI